MHLVRFPRRGLNLRYLVCYEHPDPGRTSVILARGRKWDLDADETSTFVAHLDEIAPIGPPPRRSGAQLGPSRALDPDTGAPLGDPVGEPEGGAVPVRDPVGDEHGADSQRGQPA